MIHILNPDLTCVPNIIKNVDMQGNEEAENVAKMQ